MTFSRSPGFCTGMTMVEPGTTVVGEARKRSSVAASQVSWELFMACVYP
jgi:hypothetical protein